MTDVYAKLAQLERELDRVKSFEVDRLTATAWTPTFTGFSADPANSICRYVLVGKLCTTFVRMPFAGTSNATGFTVSAPFAAATITNMVWYSQTVFTDNGAGSATLGMVTIQSAGTVFNLFRDFTGATWTAAGDKRAQFTIIYEVA